MTLRFGLDLVANLGYMPLVHRLVTIALCAALWLPSSARASEEEQVLGAPTGDTPAEETPEAPPPEAPASTPAPDGEGPADEAEQAVRAALDRLADIEVAAARGDASATRAQLDQLRDTLHDALMALGELRRDRELRTWVEQQGLAIVKVDGTEEEAAAQEAGAAASGPMTPTEVADLARSIEGAPFNEGKLQILEEGLEGRTVRIAQAEQLLELFSFSRDRVDVLVFLYPRLAEDGEFGRLLSALKFESDRQAVRDRLGLDS